MNVIDLLERKKVGVKVMITLYLRPSTTIKTITQYYTVKPRFTAGFGGKETSAVNWGFVCLQYAS